MAVSREQAIELAIGSYTADGHAVVRSRDELPGVRADSVLVLSHVTHSADIPFGLRPSDGGGPCWWVAFEGLERTDGVWGPPDFHPSGGLVRVDAVTGELCHQSLL